MKKFLAVALVALTMAIAVPASAQSAVLFPLTAGDTISTTAGKDTVSKTINCTAGYSTLSIQVVTTKLSGTIVGKAYLMSSVDGVNYQVTDSSSAFADQTTNVAIFDKVAPGRTFYKTQVRESGASVSTQGNIVRMYYVLHRYAH